MSTLWRDRLALLVHMRLHFQLLLAPVFLWGWLLAGGGISPRVLIAFVAFHVFLYSGSTAYNSYYDRDTGPVGGLERPPPVPESLLGFSLALQSIGFMLALAVDPVFAAAYLLFVALSTAYSHPRIRLKARPYASLALVGFGQGVLGFAAAWAAARGDLAGIGSADGALGAATAALLILALYPLTQIYQIDEDASRGDRTLAIVWGAKKCFAFSLACMLLGGVAMLVELARRFGIVDVVVVSIGLLVQLVLVLWLARGFDPSDILPTYRRVMRLNRLSAAALGGYLLARLTLP